MKDVGGKVEKQTDADFLTSREDLTFFYDDDGFSDTAFHSDISNGSIPDLTKSISSDVAVSYESNSLKNWTDKRSCRCTGSSGTSCQLDWSSEQSIPYSDDRRECNQEHYSKVAVTQSSCIRRGSKIFKDRDTDWANVSGFCSVSPDLSINNKRHDEDGHTQQHNNNICRNEQQCDGGVVRRPQRGRHLHWSFTHESLRPSTEWQTLEDLECCGSDIGSSDVESDESESLWSPSPEDVPSVRPDFVPKLDLSWVFEEENRKKKRLGRRCAKKVSAINGHAFAKSLTTSMSSDSSPVDATRSVKDKAKSLQFSECFGGAPCCNWEHKGQDEGAYVASAHYRLNHYDHKVDETLADKFRPHHHGSDDVRQATSVCRPTYDDAPEMVDKTVWSAETSKDDVVIQMTRCQLQPENTHCEPHFDGVNPEIRPSYQFQTSHNNSKNRSFSCRPLQKVAADSPIGIAIEDYEQPEQQKLSKELAACSFHVNDTNGQGGLSEEYLTATKHLMKVSRECAVIKRPLVTQLATYYVVDEKRDSREIRQRSLVAQHDTQETQETQDDAIHQHTMLETNCCASDTYRLRRDDPPDIDLNFTSSTTCKSDSGLGVDANSDSRISEFIKINAETTDGGRVDAVRESEGEKKEEDKEMKVREEEHEEEEEEDDENMASNETRSDELYDVEAAVFRRGGRRQKLAKFVFCFIGCQTSCCKQTRCRPCYCDWKCDVKCFR